MSSPQPDDDTLRKWIDSDTGKLKFTRFHEYNLEERTVAGADLFRIRYYKTMTEASKALRVPYKRLRSRVQGHQPVKANGGRNKALSPEEEAEVLMWAHRQMTQGHHIKGSALVQHTNTIFAARGDFEPDKQASKIWARRFMKRNADIFKRTATHSRDAKRKAGADGATIDSFVLCTFSKVRKAGHSLALNDITATREREMRLIKEKALARTNRHVQTAVIGKLGPLSMRDARLRVAKDQYSRRAAQREEKGRIFKRNIRQEMVFLRRWVAKVRLKMCAAEKAAAEDSAALEELAVIAAKAHKLSYNASHNENVVQGVRRSDGHRRHTTCCQRPPKKSRLTPIAAV
ncbi:hypothetical protein E4U59_006978 [Claviceps monticola]|nr:hypothetical protein E4U59_006978 [Claviceps monticola]